jgi:hypothetical protein
VVSVLLQGEQPGAGQPRGLGLHDLGALDLDAQVVELPAASGVLQQTSLSGGSATAKLA